MSANDRVIFALALTLARQHYSEIEFVTDEDGADLLVTKVGLKFNRVRTDLQQLDLPRSAWVAGKLKAYALQEEPFIHLDHDVLLFQPLPEKLLAAPVAVQSTEPAGWYHKPRTYCSASAWDECTRPLGASPFAYNTGLFGGTDLEFIRSYGEKALDNLRREADRKNGVSPGCMTVFEQAFLARHAADQRAEVKPLLRNWSEGEQFGYTHLMCAKQRPECLLKVRQRLQALDPELLLRAEIAGDPRA
jgi:hypothetical protein